MRAAVIASLALGVINLASADHAVASIKRNTAIVAQPLEPALEELAIELNIQILYRSEIVKDLKTGGAVGQFTVDQTLSRILSGTGLTFRHLGDSAVAIEPIARSSSVMTPSAETNSTLWERFRIAEVTESADSSGGASGTSPSSSPVTGDINARAISAEVIVTAQKKEERLLDTPVAVTVLDPQVLAQNGQAKISDYYSSVPGLSYLGTANNLPGQNYLSIRGLSNGYTANPTVSVVIDDVPVGSSTAYQDGAASASEVIPDIDPSDLSQIEVLKGPQGTLYGADSLGGLIKIVTQAPSTAAFSGRLETGVSDVPGGGQGFVLRGALNAPISDSLAVRLSGFDRQDPGYIQNLKTGQSDLGSANAYGARLATLWSASDNLTVRLGALYQRTEGTGAQIVDSNATGQFTSGDLKQTTFPGTQKYYTETQLYTAKIDGAIAGLHLTSVTGYSINAVNNTQDYSGYAFFNSLGNSLFPGSVGSPQHAHYETDKVSQELRIGSSMGHWLDWRVGLFYTHENLPISHQNVEAAAANGTINGPYWNFDDTPAHFSEYAVFGDSTVHLNERVDVQLGARESWYSTFFQETQTGAAVPIFDSHASPYVDASGGASSKSFTYLLTPQYHFSRDVSAYVRVATGYTVGGTNAYIGPAVSFVPRGFGSDTSTNYELGLKGAFLDRLLEVELATYYIDWKNLQVPITTTYIVNGTPLLTGFTTNSGSAKSEGIELNIEYRPVAGLSIQVEGAYNNAVLTSSAIPASGLNAPAGSRLPYSMPFSGGIKVNQDFPISDGWIGSIGGGVNYIDNRLTGFSDLGLTQARIRLPSYTTGSLHVGARREGGWIENLYVNNVSNSRGLLNVSPTFGLAPQGYYAAITQPRTIGLNVSKAF